MGHYFSIERETLRVIAYQDIGGYSIERMTLQVISVWGIISLLKERSYGPLPIRTWGVFY